ncbi:hypothetical protein [Absidia glauca]|uniref:Uncharacterized protein n=1 Tax=Absidia glauca TaxID=4829 RepID=A0A163KNM1_ABSGL|nr:hypothetical protein [Absidia glauca]
MTSTLPSPPLSPIDKSITLPCERRHRSNHQRHPPRRHDTFELLQALVNEHQRLEKQDYETMLREVPTIRRRPPTNAPKGILVNPSPPHNELLSRVPPSSSPPPRHAVVRFAPGPPKIYKYHKVPQEV